MEEAFGELKQKWTSGIGGQQLVFVDDKVVAFTIGPDIKLVDLTTGSESTITCAGSGVGCIAGSGTGLLAYAEEGGDVYIKTTQDELVHIISDDVNRLRYRALGFANNSQWLLTIDDALTSVVAIWDISEESPRKLVSELVELSVGSDVLISANPTNYFEVALLTTHKLLMFAVEKSGHLHHVTQRTVHLMQRKRRASLNRRSSVSEILDLDKFVNKTKIVELTCLAWSPKGDLYVGTKEGTILGVRSGEAVSMVLKSLEDGTIKCMTCVGSELVVTGTNKSSNGVARWLDTTTKNLSEVFSTQLNGAPSSMCASTGGTLVVAGPNYGVILNKQGERSFIECVNGVIAGVGVVRAAHNEYAIIISQNGVGRVHAVSSGKLKSKLDVGMTTTCLAASNRTPMVVVGSDDGCVKIVEVTETADRVIFSKKVHTGAVTHATVHATGKFFVTAGGDKVALTAITSRAIETIGFVDVEGTVIDVTIGFTGDESTVEVAVVVRNESTSQLLLASFSSKAEGLVADRVTTKLLTIDFDVSALTMSSGQLYLQEFVGDVVVVDVASLNTTTTSIEADTALAVVAGHVYSTTSTYLSTATGKVIVSVGSDGVLMARLTHSSNEICCAQPYGKKVHRFSQAQLAKPLCHIAATADGRVFVTSDGRSVFAWEWDGEETHTSISKQASTLDGVVLKAAALAEASMAKMDTCTHNDHDGVATVTQMVATEQNKALSQGASSRDTLMADINKLKTRFQELITNNESKPELEKLSHEEFQLDVAEKERLEQEGKEEMVKLKQDVQQQILEQQFLRHRVKKQCWDSMDTKGKAVYTFDGKLEVSNYPLRFRTKEELVELKKVQAAHSIETEFAKRRKQLFVSDTATDDMDFDDDDEGTEFYTHQHLHSSVKKRAQIVLLKDHIHRIKETFNEEFEDVWRNKKADIKKILDRNKSIVTVCNELKLGGIQCDPELFTPEMFALETPDELLVVKPGEVEVEHILNAGEREHKAREVAIEAEKARLAAMDNPLERGLIDMMDGSLTGRDQNEMWNPIAPPVFMTAVPEENWSDVQKYKVKEWNERVIEQQETQGKRIKALNTEQITLKASVEATKNGFDDRIRDLFDKKIATEQKLIQQELKILLLLRSLQTEADFLDNEAQLSARRMQLTSARSQRDTVVQEAEQVVLEFNANVVNAEKKSKAGEKAFKPRFLKEFPESEEVIDTLWKLFKKKAGKKHHIDSKPEGVTDDMWQRYHEMKAHKQEADKELALLQAELAARVTFLNNRKAEATEGLQMANNLLDELRGCREQRFLAALNVEVLIPIKQGLVEVHHTNDFEPEFHNAVLIPRSIVEQLNTKIIGLGQHKLDHMSASMNLKKKTHSLKWEHRRLDRLRDDLINMAREVQMLRVTKNMQLDGASQSEDINRRENETLEKTIKQLEDVIDNTIMTRKKQVASVEHKMATFNKQNKQLAPTVDELEINVEEHMMLNTVFNLNRGTNKANEAVKAAASKRRMVNTVRMQQDQIRMLREEVERIRRKTFPGFAQGQRAAF